MLRKYFLKKYWRKRTSLLGCFIFIIGITTISRVINFSGKVTSEQKERLLIIADKCPISKLLKGKININTTL
jgi:uncharacterized OsmC-like protein